MSVHGVVTIPAAEWERLRANEFAATQMAETILHQERELARLRACEAALKDEIADQKRWRRPAEIKC